MNNQKDQLKTASELLPWYANGSLSASETAMVEKQLAGSDELQQQLAALQQLAVGIQANSPEIPSAVKSFRKLQAGMPVANAGHSKSKPLAAGNWLQALRAQLEWIPAPAQAFAAIAVALVLGLLVIGNSSEPPNDFITLSDPETISAYAAADSIMIAFNDHGIAQTHISQLAREVNAAAISGPNSVNAYQLYFVDATQRDQALTVLREKMELQLVEPVQK